MTTGSGNPGSAGAKGPDNPPRDSADNSVHGSPEDRGFDDTWKQGTEAAGGTEDDAFDALLREAFELPQTADAPEDAMLRCLRCGASGRPPLAQCPVDGGPLVPAGDARMGQLVGPYRVLEYVGGGGIGSVYRARHRTLGAEAAVKFLRPEFAQMDEHRVRLEREARMIGQLDHEHIVRVIDFIAEPDSSPVLVLEFIRGQTLEDALEGGPFSPERAAYIARQIARALARAHQLGVLHRDIKPSNVLLTQVGRSTDFVKVLDFGIGREQESLGLTRSDTTLGTPHYMSPEQTRCTALGPSSDLYALGCVMFEMLTGRPPFDGSTAIVMYAHAHEAPPAVEAWAQNVPKGLAAIVLRLLQKSPDKRFDDAHGLIRAIDAVFDGPPQAEPREGDPGVSPWKATAPPERTLEQRLYEHFRLLESIALPGPEVTQAEAALQALTAARDELTTADREALNQRLGASHARAQVGRALDVLGRDASEAAAAKRTLARSKAESDGAQLSAVAGVCRALSEWDATPGDVSGLVDAARRLSDAEEARRMAARALTENEQRAEDLQFQVDQLKGRLASLVVDERTLTDANEARLAALHVRHQAALEAAAAALDALDEAAAATPVPER